MTTRRQPVYRETWFTARNLLVGLAFISMAGSAVYWWGIQDKLAPGEWFVTIPFTALRVFGPPALVSFLIPWTPGGMFLQKMNARTWGFAAVFACAIYLIYDAFQLQWAFWAAHPVVAQSEMVYQQSMIGVIGFIIIPALLFTPIRSEELINQARQAHLIKRYELQTEADISILRATLLRAQEKALIGFANLSVAEKQELDGVMRSLVFGIDATLKEVGKSVKTVSGATVQFDELKDSRDVADVLDYISETLFGSMLGSEEHELLPEPEPEPAGRSMRSKVRRGNQ